MKTIIKIFLSGIAIISVMSACTDQNKLMFHEKTSAYFYPTLQNPQSDSTSFTFLGKPDTVTKYVIPVGVRISGLAEDKDRGVAIIIESKSTAVPGVNFEKDSAVIPAGAYNVLVPITLKRTADLKSTIYSLILKIVDSKDINAGFATSLKYKIDFTEKAVKPRNWPQSYYGDYSDAKLTFMYQILGSGINWGGYPPYHMANSATLRTALAKYERDNGPLIDAATGTRVVFPG